jgi:hypothetical protein
MENENKNVLKKRVEKKLSELTQAMLSVWMRLRLVDNHNLVLYTLHPWCCTWKTAPSILETHLWKWMVKKWTFRCGYKKIFIWKESSEHSQYHKYAVGEQIDDGIIKYSEHFMVKCNVNCEKRGMLKKIEIIAIEMNYDNYRTLSTLLQFNPQMNSVREILLLSEWETEIKRVEP